MLSMFKRVLAVGSAAVLAVGLGACTASDTPAEAENPTQTSGNGEPAPEVTEIDFSTWWAYVDDELIQRFHDANPDVKVNLQFTAVDGYTAWLQAQTATGELPDVISVGGNYTPEMGAAGHFMNLKEFLGTEPYDGEAATWEESFIPVLLDNAQGVYADIGEDEYWSVPFGALSVAGLYNQDIFEEVGITPPTSFDQLLANCTTLKDAGYIPMSLTGQTWVAWFFTLGWDQSLREAPDKSYTADNPAFVKAFENVAEMAEAGCWDPSQINTDIEGETALFLQEKTAQFISVPENFLAAVVEGATFNLGSYVMPAISGAGNPGLEPVHTLGGGTANMVAISATTEHAEAAARFAKFLTSTEVQGHLAETIYTMPSINIDLSEASPVMEAYAEAGSNGFINGSELPRFTTEGRTIFYSEVAPRLVLGDITPEEAAEATVPLLRKTGE